MTNLPNIVGIALLIASGFAVLGLFWALRALVQAYEQRLERETRELAELREIRDRFKCLLERLHRERIKQGDWS